MASTDGRKLKFYVIEQYITFKRRGQPSFKEKVAFAVQLYMAVLKILQKAILITIAKI